jgi:hypothetical protein
MEIKESQITELLEMFESELIYYNSLEYQSAPSGEYTDYNHDIIVQEAVVGTYISVFDILDIEYKHIQEKYLEEEED